MELIRIVGLTDFGPRLREMRKERGLTQMELATSALISDSAVSAFELGTDFPKMETTLSLAAALQCVIVFDPLNLVYHSALRQMADDYAARVARTVHSDLREDR